MSNLELNKELKNLELNKLKVDYSKNGIEFSQYSELNKILTEKDIQEISDNSERVTFQEGDVIIGKDEEISHMFFMSKGTVLEVNGDKDDETAPYVMNKPGDILGLQFMTKNTTNSFTTWIAISEVIWDKFWIKELCKRVNSREQERKLWYYIGPAIINLNEDEFPMFKELDVLEIKLLLKSSNYESYDKDLRISLEKGAILFEGKLKTHDSEELVISGPCLIYPSDKSFEVMKECKMFRLPEKLKDCWRDFDYEVFTNKFDSLSKVKQQHFYNSTQKRRATKSNIKRKQKMHLPKSLTKGNEVDAKLTPSQMDIERSIEKQVKGDFEKISAQGTILPKGMKPSKNPQNVEGDIGFQNKVAEIYQNQATKNNDDPPLQKMDVHANDENSYSKSSAASPNDVEASVQDSESRYDSEEGESYESSRIQDRSESY